MRVYTKSGSIYEIEIGEGFEVKFRRLEGKTPFSWQFEGRDFYGRLDGPLCVGECFRIRRDQHEWPSEDLIYSTEVIKIEEDIPDANS